MKFRESAVYDTHDENDGGGIRSEHGGWSEEKKEGLRAGRERVQNVPRPVCELARPRGIS